MMNNPWKPGLPAVVSLNPGVLAQIVERAGSANFEAWWAAVSHAGFCANPVHLSSGHRAGQGEVLSRCKNRRAVVCPSCSALYAGDTWQLVHAGIAGGHHGLPASLIGHPMVFVTLTAPGFGAVHGSGRLRGQDRQVCHPGDQGAHCRHGRGVGCAAIHDEADPLVGQPLCADCYDYVRHVAFSWHLPELWHRFVIGLRRAISKASRQLGDDPKAVRVAYVKVVEMQRRAIPHVHTVIRLDAGGVPGEPVAAPTTTLSSSELAGLVLRVAAATRLAVSGTNERKLTLRFGPQTDVQAITPSGVAASDDQAVSSVQHRLSAYLAKYVTKSVAESGLGTNSFGERSIPYLDVTDHVRRILETVVAASRETGQPEMLRWLHTLGYRGQITTKTRRYSTTMGALRQARADWRAGGGTPTGPGEDLDWRFTGYGHAGAGDMALVLSAAERERERRQVAREALSDGDDRAAE